MPTVDAADKLELGKEFSYKVTFDTFPKIELPEYKGLEYEELEVEVGEEDVERELKGLQEQNSVVVDKKDPVAAKGDIVNVDYVELEEGGEEKTATRRQSFVFEVGSGYNLYRFDEEIVGMKAGEEKTIAKEYPADFEVKELAGRKLSLKVKLNTVKEKQLPEINDELAQDISDKYKSLDDLKKDIREKLARHASQQGAGAQHQPAPGQGRRRGRHRPAQVHAGTASWRTSGSASWGACGPTSRRRAARAGQGGAQQAERAGGMEAGRGEEAAPAAGGERDGQARERRGQPGGAGRPGQGGRRGAQHQLRAGQGDLHQEPPATITWPSTSRTRSSTTSCCPPAKRKKGKKVKLLDLLGGNY